MNIDIQLIKLMLNKLLYNKYNNIINLEFYKNNNRELFKIFLTLSKLQALDGSEQYTAQDLALYFYTQYPNVKAEEKVLLDIVFSQVDAVVLDDAMALDYLNAHHEQTVATQIAMEALNISRGQGDMMRVKELINSLEINVEVPTSSEFVSTDLELLLSEINSSEGLRWRLDTLNKSLGSLRKGDFGFIVKRPETGGTTFLANQIGYILSTTKDRKILWVNNEEQGEKVVIRVFQSYFGATYQQIITNAPDYNERFKDEVGDRFSFYDNTIASSKDVERLCARVNPDLLIFDQLDKIKGFHDEREDLRLGNIYIWARELAKRYCPVIAVTQASGDAEGKKYLTMDMIANSKTAKAAEADWILGIGMTHNDGEESVRYLSIMKNKLLGDPDSKPELRHGKMPVIIQPEIARFQDSIKWN